MNTYAGSQSALYTVNINGTFNGWCGSCNAMSDADGDGVWDVTLPPILVITLDISLQQMVGMIKRILQVERLVQIQIQWIYR